MAALSAVSCVVCQNQQVFANKLTKIYPGDVIALESLDDDNKTSLINKIKGQYGVFENSCKGIESFLNDVRMGLLKQLLGKNYNPDLTKDAQIKVMCVQNGQGIMVLVFGLDPETIEDVKKEADKTTDLNSLQSHGELASEHYKFYGYGYDTSKKNEKMVLLGNKDKGPSGKELTVSIRYNQGTNTIDSVAFGDWFQQNLQTLLFEGLRQNAKEEQTAIPDGKAKKDWTKEIIGGIIGFSVLSTLTTIILANYAKKNNDANKYDIPNAII